jgi:DNA-binding NarL/FixJ family response regulator
MTKAQIVYLTKRQNEVLDILSSEGLSNKGIANRLGISDHTVKVHITAILKAYSMTSRIELIMHVNEYGK